MDTQGQGQGQGQAGAAAGPEVEAVRRELEEARKKAARWEAKRDALFAAVEALPPGPEKDDKRKDLQEAKEAFNAATAEVARLSAEVLRREELLRGVGPAAKRLQVSKAPLAKFLLTELTDGSGEKLTSILSDTSKHARGVALRGALCGDESRASFAFVRGCYSTLFKTIDDIFSKEKAPSALLAGTRGIGKSVFGSFAVLEWASRGTVVVYEHLETLMLVVGDPARAPASVQAEFRERGEALRSGVFSLRDEAALLESLLAMRDVVFVQDLGDSPTSRPIKRGNCGWLVVSSPNSDKLDVLRSVSDMHRFIMPLWSLDEMLELRQEVFILSLIHI